MRPPPPTGSINWIYAISPRCRASMMAERTVWLGMRLRLLSSVLVMGLVLLVANQPSIAMRSYVKPARAGTAWGESRGEGVGDSKLVSSNRRRPASVAPVNTAITLDSTRKGCKPQSNA